MFVCVYARFQLRKLNYTPPTTSNGKINMDRRKNTLWSLDWLKFRVLGLTFSPILLLPCTHSQQKPLNFVKSGQTFCPQVQFVLVSVIMHANINLAVLQCKHTHTHTEAPDKAAGLAPASMAAGLTGAKPGRQVVGGSAAEQPSSRVSGFLPLPRSAALCTPDEGAV